MAKYTLQHGYEREGEVKWMDIETSTSLAVITTAYLDRFTANVSDAIDCGWQLRVLKEDTVTKLVEVTETKESVIAISNFPNTRT